MKKVFKVLTCFAAHCSRLYVVVLDYNVNVNGSNVAHCSRLYVVVLDYNVNVNGSNVAQGIYMHKFTMHLCKLCNEILNQ